MLKKLMVYVVEKLVDQPEAIHIEETETDGQILIKIRVAQEDLGKIIGKEGKVARTLRTLAAAVASRDGKTANVEIEK